MSNILKYGFVLVSCCLLCCSHSEYRDNLALLQRVDNTLGLIIKKTFTLIEIQYNAMEMALLNDPAKVRPDYDRARQLKNKREQIFSDIDAVKKSVLYEIYGEDSMKMDFPAETKAVDFSEFKSNVYELKSKLDSLIIFCQNSFSSQHVTSRDTFLQNLPEDFKEDKEKWTESNFNNKPLIAFITSLDNLKLQILHCEYFLLYYLYDKIGERLIRFDTLQAFVFVESNLIKLGQKYKAEIFLASIDTDADAMVLMGKVDENTFQITGKADTLKVEKGIARYSVSATGPGAFTYSGVYVIKDSFHGNKHFPLKGEYQVIKN